MSRAQNRRTRYSYAGDRSWTPSTEPVVHAPQEVDHGDLRYGLDLNDLNASASIAIRINRRTAGDPAERFDVAWSAAAEHLYASTEPVTRRGLVEAACRALDRNMEVDLACHGVARADRGAGTYGSAPRFAAYWAPTAAVGVEEKVIESLALVQVWPLLTDGERASLAALAAHGDVETAAEATGMAYEAFRKSVRRGRDRVWQLWHEGETRPTREAKTGKALRAQWARRKRRLRALNLVTSEGA